MNLNNSPASAVAVLGGGSWGTALAMLCASTGCPVRLWARDAEVARQVSEHHHNPRYFPGVSLPGVTASTDLPQSVAGAAFVLVAVPGAALAETAARVLPLVDPAAVIISGTKGLDPQGRRPSEIWKAAGLGEDRLAALSGPNLAREMVRGVPTSSVVASVQPLVAGAAQQLLGTPTFRVYTNTDLVGVELGGALKNVVAIAAGICDGLGFGDNAKAALITRAWVEMTRLAVSLGARERTLYGLSGMGDLLATCASTQSRNHELGRLLGQGLPLSAAQQEVQQVAEGVHTTRAALHLARQQALEMPITAEVAAVLFEGKTPHDAVVALMSRQGKSE